MLHLCRKISVRLATSTLHSQGTNSNYGIKWQFKLCKSKSTTITAWCHLRFRELFNIVSKNKSRIEQFKSFCSSISVFVRAHLLNFHKFHRPGQSRVPWAERELRDDEPDQGRGWGLGLIHNFREYAEQKLFGDFSYQIFKSNLSPHSTLVHDLISCPHMYFF